MNVEESEEWTQEDIQGEVEAWGVDSEEALLRILAEDSCNGDGNVS